MGKYRGVQERPTIKPPIFEDELSKEEKRLLDNAKANLNELEKKEPLLIIELEDETSVPKVFYKGEEIKNRKDIMLHWETDDVLLGGLTYRLEYYNKEQEVVELIERRTKGHR